MQQMRVWGVVLMLSMSFTKMEPLCIRGNGLFNDKLGETRSDSNRAAFLLPKIREMGRMASIRAPADTRIVGNKSILRGDSRNEQTD